MALIVHKYGGTSMGSTERIRNVAKRVAKWVRAGHQIVVVPSAMSGETNRLPRLAKTSLSPHSRGNGFWGPAGKRTAGRRLTIGKLCRLAGAGQDGLVVHQ